MKLSEIQNVHDIAETCRRYYKCSDKCIIKQFSLNGAKTLNDCWNKETLGKIKQHVRKEKLEKLLS